jgi:hypothetical protein
VKEDVQKRAQLKRDTENRIHEYRRKIEDLRQSKVKEEMKAMKVSNDIAELDDELAHACAAAEETKRKLEPVKVSSHESFHPPLSLSTNLVHAFQLYLS